MTFPDVPKAVAHLVADLVQPGYVPGSMPDRADIATPPDLQAQLPFVRVGRTGGTDDGVTDTATVEVDCFAATRDEALAVAEAVRDRLTLSYNLVNVDGSTVLLEQASTAVGPRDMPWLATGVRRLNAVYRIGTRRS